jgi:hypothetical protein
LGEREQEQHGREDHGRADVLVGLMACLRPLVEGPVGDVVQPGALVEEVVLVLGHEARTGWRVGVRERIDGDPGVEGDLELRTEPALVERGEVVESLVPRLDPRVERGDVEQSLLTAEGECLIRLVAYRRGRAVELRLAPVPPRCVVAAPCGGDGDDREEERLDDLDGLFPSALRRTAALRRDERLGDLAVEFFRHRHLVRRKLRV